jgi:hypothetical protein
MSVNSDFILHLSYPLQLFIMKAILYLSYNTVFKDLEVRSFDISTDPQSMQLENIILLVQTEGHIYAQQMCISVDHNKIL